MDIQVINAGNCMMCGREIKIVAKRGNNKFPNIFFCPRCERQFTGKDKEMIKAEIKTESEETQDHTEWIPVSKRLPNHDEYIKNNGLFIVSNGNKSYFEWFDIYNTQRFLEPTIAGFYVDNAVIAWMPLPEPYKAEMGSEV